MLLGLAVISVPLVLAVFNAAVQMRKLTTASQQLVVQSVQTTRLSQDMFAAIAAVERTTRLYEVLADPKLLAVFEQNDRRLTTAREQLAVLLAVPEVASGAAQIATLQEAIRRGFAAGVGSTAFAGNLAAVERISTVSAHISAIASAQIDAELQSLAAQGRDARTQLFWQAAVLALITLVALLALAIAIVRPVRQIDRAISELGRGTFSRAVSVSGPADLQRLGRQLEWLRLRLLELAEDRNRFLRHMSHELKTPLANIREGTELLMDGAVGELDSNQREVMVILRDNGLRLQRLIENLLSFSAWQTQSSGLELSEIRVRAVIKQVLENQQLTLLSQRVRLDVKVDDVSLYADRGKLRLIIDNLLSNAIKYSPKGGTIHLHAKAEGDSFVLQIADGGKGIAAEDRARIFDAFYTGGAPQTGHVRGTGIGLSVVLEFVAAHGGTIEILDGVYPGAHFRVRMPLRYAAMAGVRAPQRSIRSHAASPAKPAATERAHAL